MTDIAKALTSLGVTEWVLRGEPQSFEEFNEMFRKVTGADKNGSAIESADPKDWGVTWKQVSDEKKKLEDAEPMRVLRERRTQMLSESDWMANSDVTMSDEWKTYRQALRDITKTYKNQMEVVWPTPPS